MPTDPTDELVYWENRAAAWDRDIEVIEAFSGAFGEPALDALELQPGERVVDIGCGPGTTAVELAARVGPTGAVIALDLAEAMINAARRRAEAVGATNIRGVVHDLETGPIDEALDAGFSRFGVMFFPAPELAFANIARSLRTGGRFACCVWGPLGDNPWMFVPTLAAAGELGAELGLPEPGEPGPFSLADPARLESLLAGAGFGDIVVTPVDSSRFVSRTTAPTEIAAMLEIGPVGGAFEAADAPTRQRAVNAVIEAFAPFEEPGDSPDLSTTGDGWRLAGSALVVSAVVRG